MSHAAPDVPRSLTGNDAKHVFPRLRLKFSQGFAVLARLSADAVRTDRTVVYDDGFLPGAAQEVESILGDDMMRECLEREFGVRFVTVNGKITVQAYNTNAHTRDIERLKRYVDRHQRGH